MDPQVRLHVAVAKRFSRAQLKAVSSGSKVSEPIVVSAHRCHYCQPIVVSAHCCHCCQWVGATGTFGRASGTQSVAEGPKFDTMMGPLQGSLVPNFMILAQTVFEILADFIMTKRTRWMDGWMDGWMY